jgi:N-acetylneuraminate synthase
MLLTEFAHQIGLLVGISFFTEEDILDFGNEVDKFDFFKIPSAELTNLNLILALIAKNKFVLVSTGAHYEFEIEQIFSQLPENGWMPLHCISNYPTLPFNSNLGYINFLEKKWKKPVGYSSHDSNWELNIGAIAIGARVIERHITKDSNASGLDHSSSSTHSDLVRICQIANSSKDIFFKELPRTPNQGELINFFNSYVVCSKFRLFFVLKFKFQNSLILILKFLVEISKNVPGFSCLIPSKKDSSEFSFLPFIIKSYSKL